MRVSSPSVDYSTGSATPIDAALLALAPLRLRNFRQVRYTADDLCVALGQLAERDQTLIRRLYDDLTELLYLIADSATDDAQKWLAVDRWTQRHNLDVLIDEVREIGAASTVHGTSENLSKALHDLRGGALSALLGRLQLANLLPQLTSDLNSLFVLARDHLKIMRSALVGLDDSRRQADHTRKSHDMQLILDKWQCSVVGLDVQPNPVRMFLDCRYRGALTECCLESAAVDRIFYNLANNACRHLAGDRLDMAVFPVPDATGDCLRFVLSNTVTEADAAFLRGLLPEGGDSVDKGIGQSLFTLFEPAMSSTGSGFGLTVVADFVTGAFGLTNRREALEKRYVGAILDGQTFRVWFHWPAANEALPHKLDDFHRPQESLSEA